MSVTLISLLGYEMYTTMRADPCLCFLERAGRPDDKAIDAEQHTGDAELGDEWVTVTVSNSTYFEFHFFDVLNVTLWLTYWTFLLNGAFWFMSCRADYDKYSEDPEFKPASRHKDLFEEVWIRVITFIGSVCTL